jgi:hypothetical protein
MKTKRKFNVFEHAIDKKLMTILLILLKTKWRNKIFKEKQIHNNPHMLIEIWRKPIHLILFY